jgi:hypothetical protein
MVSACPISRHLRPRNIDRPQPVRVQVLKHQALNTWVVILQAACGRLFGSVGGRLSQAPRSPLSGTAKAPIMTGSRFRLTDTMRA